MGMAPDSEADRLGELSRRIEEWLNDSSSRAETLRTLVSRVRSEQLASPRRVEPAVAPPTALADTAHLVSRFARELEAARDQSAILGALVQNAALAAGRVLLFIVRGESVIGWGARGLPPEFQARSATFPLTSENLVSRCRRLCAAVMAPPMTRTGNAEILAQLGGVVPGRMMAAPVWVRDRVAAILYADTGETGGPWHPDAICLMTTLTGLNLEVLPVRQKHPRPVAEPEVTIEESATEYPVPVESGEQPALRQQTAGDGPREPADPEQEARQDEAVRFARLLASEIVLYNAAELEDGRRHKDIYGRLKDEIDRSHQMFEERFTSREPGINDCFRNELVRVLAEGDETALTLPWS